MVEIRQNMILLILILFLGCEKELDINDFADDFANYEQELRIEALILPAKNSAIVRIDRTIPINESELYNCIDDDGDWDITTDDLGEDGVAADPDNGIELDAGEGNGVPDCGEPHVDEYSEILPEIHISNCTVSISNGNATCTLLYNDNAGSFFLDTNLKENDISEVDVVNYGGYIPNDECIANNFDFSLYDTEYSFNCTCQGEYAKYGEIIAFDTISKPVIFFNPDSLNNIENCASSEYVSNNEVYNCLEVEHISNNMELPFGSDEKIYYASLFENRFYYAEQSFYDEENNRYIYWHGHAAGGTEDAGYLINDKVSWFREEIITRDLFGITQFKYDIYTFSEAYSNYFFYVDLDLNDPVRTNLRDSNGNPVMGAFGSMNSNTKFFEIIP